MDKGLFLIGKRRGIVFAVAVAGLVIWPFLVSNRGIDPTDTAFLLWGYQDAIRDASAVPMNRALSTWLSMLALMPLQSGQWLAIRLLGAAACGGMLVLGALSLYRMFPLRTLLPFMLVATLFAGQFPAIIGYNSLSYLFLAAEIYLLLRALEKDSRNLLLGCGLLLGLGVYIRLPNLFHFALAAVVLWRYGLCERRWEKALSRLWWLLLPALAIALATGAFCLLVLGPEKVIGELNLSASRALTSPTGEVMTYSLAGMVLNFITLLWKAGKTLLGVIATVIVAGQVLLLLKYRWRIPRPILWGFNALAIAGIAALGFVKVKAVNYPSSYPTMDYSALLGGLCILTCTIALLYYRHKAPARSTMAAAALVVLFVSPFGTNTLFIAYTNYWHLTLPATAGFLYCLWTDFSAWIGRISGNTFKTPMLVTNLLPVLLLGVCLAQSALPVTWHPYLESPYYELTEPVEGIPAMAGMRTTPENARMFETYARVLKPYSGYTLINMGAFAAGPLITGMAPALGHSYPVLPTFTDELFLERLGEIEEEGKEPVISFTDITHAGVYYDAAANKTQALLAFIQRHGYMQLYMDESHLIFVPK